MDQDELFFTQVGSMCMHAEETLGTDLFLKITLDNVTVNPMLTYPSTVVYLNSNGKLKIYPNYNFRIAELRNDEWLDNFIDSFKAEMNCCESIIGVIDSSRDLNWYIKFVTEVFGSQAIERSGQGILL